MSLWYHRYWDFMGHIGSTAGSRWRCYRWFDSDVLSTPLSFLVLIGIVELSCIIFGQGSFAVSQAGEDGSYYVVIAHNMATGKGITFDGIAPIATGHWGWLLLLAGVFKLLPTADPVTLFRIAGATYYLTLFAAGCVIYRFTPIGALFMVAYLANRGHWYMETHLVLLTLAMAIRWPNHITGFLLSAVRTDMVLFALFARKWNLAIGAGIGFIWACIFNVLVDGSLVPVSAQIKAAGWNDWATIVRMMGALGKYYFPILPIMCLLSVLDMDRWFIAACGLILIHLFHNSLTEGWYLAPLFLISLLCASRVLNDNIPKLWDKWRLVGLSRVR